MGMIFLDCFHDTFTPNGVQILGGNQPRRGPQGAQILRQPTFTPYECDPPNAGLATPVRGAIRGYR